jgi:hypothetical protein
MYQTIGLLILFVPNFVNSFQYPFVERNDSIKESHFGIEVRNLIIFNLI